MKRSFRRAHGGEQARRGGAVAVEELIRAKPDGYTISSRRSRRWS